MSQFAGFPRDDPSKEALIGRLLRVIDQVYAEVRKLPVQLEEGPAFPIMSFREKMLWRGKVCSHVVSDISAHIAAFKSQTAPRYGVRIYWKKEGSHVRTRWFVGTAPADADRTYGKSGDLVFSRGEWDDIQPLLSGCGFLIAKG